ncbi:hypothetical protein ACFX13_019179 [Malus domestica]
MVGSQAIIACKRTDGTMTVHSSPIKSYGIHLEKGNLSFPLYDVSAAYENNQVIIFATIVLPNNVSVVHHVWQQRPMFGNNPGMHSLSGPNVQSFGTLDREAYQVPALLAVEPQIHHPWTILLLGGIILLVLERIDMFQMHLYNSGNWKLGRKEGKGLGYSSPFNKDRTTTANAASFIYLGMKKLFA